MKKRIGSASTLAVVVIALLSWWLGSCDDGGRTPGAGGSATSGTSASTRHGTDPESGLPWISESELPPEAVETLRLIDAGGPFPYEGKDGSTFGNFEGVLPDEPDGYYREYTVPTPGEDDRGARRIVTGRGGEYYYTDDHYESFSRIDR